MTDSAGDRLPLNCQLVTIVAEGYLRARLVDDVMRLGASGYTLASAHGVGSRGVHTEDFEGANVRIEVMASAETAHRLLLHLETTYFVNYSIVAWSTGVHVVRPEKYR